MVNIVSALLCAGFAVLWVRSYWIADSAERRTDYDQTGETKESIALTSSRGRVMASWYAYDSRLYASPDAPPELEIPRASPPRTYGYVAHTRNPPLLADRPLPIGQPVRSFSLEGVGFAIWTVAQHYTIDDPWGVKPIYKRVLQNGWAVMVPHGFLVLATALPPGVWVYRRRSALHRRLAREFGYDRQDLRALNERRAFVTASSASCLLLCAAMLWLWLWAGTGHFGYAGRFQGKHQWFVQADQDCIVLGRREWKEPPGWYSDRGSWDRDTGGTRVDWSFAVIGKMTGGRQNRYQALPSVPTIRVIILHDIVPVFLFAMVGIAPLAWRRSRHSWRIRRILTGRCPKCGYDLRSSHVRCPECGHGLPDSHHTASRSAALAVCMPMPTCSRTVTSFSCPSSPEQVFELLDGPDAVESPGAKSSPARGARGVGSPYS